MSNRTLGIVATILGVLLLLGVIGLYWAMPATPVIPKCPDIPECKPVVITETVVNETTIEVESDYKQQVVDALLSEVGKDKAFRICNKQKYDADEITLKKVYPGFTLKENSDEETSISGVKIKLNYDDGKCYRTFTCGLDSEQELSC